MINQLFKCEPDKQLLNDILKCFNLKNINDNTEFNTNTLKYINTTEKMINLIPNLVLIYLPCKLKYLYITNIKNCITILRQILFIYKIKIKKRIVYNYGDKITYYHIDNLGKPISISYNKTLHFTRDNE